MLFFFYSPFRISTNDCFFSDDNNKKACFVPDYVSAVAAATTGRFWDFEVTNILDFTSNGLSLTKENDDIDDVCINKKKLDLYRPNSLTIDTVEDLSEIVFYITDLKNVNDSNGEKESTNGSKNPTNNSCLVIVSLNPSGTVEGLISAMVEYTEKGFKHKIDTEWAILLTKHYNRFRRVDEPLIIPHKFTKLASEFLYRYNGETFY